MAKVLIVEDDVDLCETYIDALESVGHEVEAISDSTQVIDRLVRERLRPDVVILDLNLIGLSGLTVLGLIRRMPRLKDTKVVVASGYPDLARRAVELWGADLFLSKPVSMDQLLSTMRSFVTSRAS